MKRMEQSKEKKKLTPKENVRVSIENYLDPILRINGQERFSKRGGDFFRYIEPYKGNYNIPEKIIYNFIIIINDNSTCYKSCIS